MAKNLTRTYQRPLPARNALSEIYMALYGSAVIGSRTKQSLLFQICTLGLDNFTSRRHIHGDLNISNPIKLFNEWAAGGCTVVLGIESDYPLEPSDPKASRTTSRINRRSCSCCWARRLPAGHLTEWTLLSSFNSMRRLQMLNNSLLICKPLREFSIIGFSDSKETRSTVDIAFR